MEPTSGQLLKAAREVRGLSRSRFATKADVCEQTAARAEHGDYPIAALPATRARLWRLAGLLVQPADAPGEWHDARKLVRHHDELWTRKPRHGI